MLGSKRILTTAALAHLALAGAFSQATHETKAERTLKPSGTSANPATSGTSTYAAGSEEKRWNEFWKTYRSSPAGHTLVRARGNKPVQRLARKTKNKAKHRRACRS